MAKSKVFSFSVIILILNYLAKILKILEKKYSPKSRAQRFGEKVYKQTKAIGDDELKKKLKSVVAIIRSKMIEMENNSETK